MDYTQNPAFSHIIAETIPRPTPNVKACKVSTGCAPFGVKSFLGHCKASQFLHYPKEYKTEGEITWPQLIIFPTITVDTCKERQAESLVLWETTVYSLATAIQ